MCSLSGSLLVVDETASTQGRWFALLIPAITFEKQKIGLSGEEKRVKLQPNE